MRRLGPLLALVATLGACHHPGPSLLLVGGRPVPAERVDADPLGILPSGALFTARLDARALFATPLARETTTLVAQVLPLGAESNFEPARDVQRVFGAFYAMQGADFCAVLQGSFDIASIERAASQRAATPSGTPLVRTRYAGHSIYTVANLGFVVLTPHTILSGDETGMRRALDRLRSGKLDHEQSPWMTAVLSEPRAAFAMVGDFERQKLTQAAAEQLPFVDGAVAMRILGNFEPPGLNVVGTFGYRDTDAAKRGAGSLAQLRELAAFASFFGSFVGVTAPRLDVQTHERDVSFASSADTSTVQFVLGSLAQVVRPATATWSGR